MPSHFADADAQIDEEEEPKKIFSMKSALHVEGSRDVVDDEMTSLTAAEPFSRSKTRVSLTVTGNG